MFSTSKQKLLLVLYVIIILSIPAGTYLISQYQTIKGRASESKSVSSPVTKITSKDGGLDSTLEELLHSTPTPTSDKTSSPTVATSFGPTLSFKISIEGRPKDNQAGKIFVAVSEGSLVVNPKFLLTFLVDVPFSGEYENLSIAGLSPGSQYTALLKGSAQIATSSAFIMSPTETKLNDGKVLNLLSGDLNEDNVVNTADYSIAQNALGSTSTSSKWNENADLNKDGVVNAFDIAIILKNLGRIGDSGVWVSTPDATPSGSLTEESDKLPVGSTGGSTGGYWLWIPK